MNAKYIYLMALTGSVLGILGSVFWVYYGTIFIGGWIEGDVNRSLTLADSALRTGLIVAFSQSIITIAFFIITLVKTTVWNIQENAMLTGKWFLYIGIGNAVINLFHLVPCGLIVAAGIYCMKQDRNTAESLDNDSKTGEETAGVTQS